MPTSKILELIFKDIESLTNTERSDSFEILLNNKVHLPLITDKRNSEKRQEANANHPLHWQYIEKIIETLNYFSEIIREDETILISVKNQKLLRSCFQLITSIGLLPCLIPGVGIHLNKRCENFSKLPPIKMNDTEKYSFLKLCTDFFAASYGVPVLKNIILTLHFADYLAALIQLSYAPLKKPGVYDGFTMTEDMYHQLQKDRTKYVQIFENLVSTCFQPMLMKELLILQSGSDPSPPLFVKRVIGKELSKRLLAQGGLLSLIRCFIESPVVDAGNEWQKIDMIRRIVATKHGDMPDDVYLTNISRQLKEAMVSSNIIFYSTAASCIFHLKEKYPQNREVEDVWNEILKAFEPEALKQRCSLPGTIILTSQEIEHKINILHLIFCSPHLNESSELLTPNFYVLFLIRLKCTKGQKIEEKIDNLILKHLEECKDDLLRVKLKDVLFGYNRNLKISVEEYDSGIILKSQSDIVMHPSDEAAKYFVALFKRTGNAKFASKIFEICLEIFLALTKQRKRRANQTLLSIEEECEFIDNLDVSYAVTLRLLEELSSLPKVLSFIAENPDCMIKFIESILLQSRINKNDECVTIALVLLNTILSESDHIETLKNLCIKIIPVLQQISSNDSDNGLLANEILGMITDTKCAKDNGPSEYELVLSNVFDSLLPVRAHGLIELTKLIDKKDPETLSKKHFVMCLFQEQLKDEDSYIYLSAINGIAALAKHSTQDVLNVLCKEFLEVSTNAVLETKASSEKRAQLRMKVGDVIVKITRSLGEMSSVYKTLLLNTVLCACRDDDPLIRASALSNLAEIALVLNYKLGTIIYEILLCTWTTLETDKAVECRRAAVLVVSSLLRGLGRANLLQLQDSLLHLYRTLKRLHGDPDEDEAVRLHAQIALDELNDIVKSCLLQNVDMEKKIVISGIEKPEIRFK